MGAALFLGNRNLCCNLLVIHREAEAHWFVHAKEPVANRLW
jgi:hypothetical protein